MLDADWKSFAWTCGKCDKPTLRVLNISAQPTGVLVFETQCGDCKHESSLSYHFGELYALYHHEDEGFRFVEPATGKDDRMIISLVPLLACCFCGKAECHIGEVRFSDEGILVETACFECAHGRSVRELSFDAMLGFCAREQAYAPIVISEWISPDEIDLEMERPYHGPS